MKLSTEARPEKVAVVDEVRERLGAAEAVIVTEYRGLTVSQMSTLRSELRPVGGKYRVYKNTLAKRAADEAGVDIGDLLVGPTALAFVEEKPDGGTGDVVSVAKVLRDFAKANPDLVVKGGVFDGDVMDAAELSKLADVEPREVLLAKLAGMIAAPMTQFAGLLQALPRDFAYGLKALIDQGGAPGAPAAEESAPAAEDAAPEEAAAEAPAEDAAPEEAAAEAPAEDAVAEEPAVEEAAPVEEENDSPDAGEGEGN
ncbi:MAG: large subunit ribosomal protein L10 [Acidimicrobiales bacterium]